jgi:hypothetical protein
MNLDAHPVHTNLAVDYGGKQELEEFKIGSRGCDGFFYTEVPEFRVEYVHDRVEY